MKLPSRRAVFVIAILGILASSWLVLRAPSQDTSERGALYVDENGEPQVVGQPANPERVSLIRLIANRERYDGKEVVTQGFFVYAYEQKGLYVSREDAFHGLSHNALVLDGTLRSSEPDEDARTAMRKGHCQYVTIGGTFHKLGRGHLHAHYAGQLTDLVIQQVHRRVDEIPPLRMKDVEKGRP